MQVEDLDEEEKGDGLERRCGKRFGAFIFSRRNADLVFID
jgi:hypothetical protein